MHQLKLKKMYEAEVEKLNGTRMTLENQILALESATLNVEIIKSMREGADAMRATRGTLDSDKVDDILDAIQEEKDIADQISEAISRPTQGLMDDVIFIASIFIMLILLIYVSF
jgi:charged multivesicular body protein 4